MLYLLSPAKSLDYETPTPPSLLALASQPQFVPQSSELIKLLRAKTPADIANMMDLSEALTELNVARFAAWKPSFNHTNSKPAVLAFNGDVYEGLAAANLSTVQLQWAQEHVAILSGLYGVLRPLDLIRPYRLEMGSRLANPAGANLYKFWGERLAQHLNARARSAQVPVIVNLASQEYFRAANRPGLLPRVIECVFEDWKNGQYKIISFFAKRARGLMARYAITERIDTPAGLHDFAAEGYAFQAALSEPGRLVFRRKLESSSL
ncbi:peroxide stress protein YaaA [Paucibacter sp. B2R-40]|uniref:peroxide stress protein YaaA n=1 Tax=Paucibacter sp. B2R-40 TaxID=2893554 RepID=UPI0021E366CD|nr:peroxide stress protein YaaA [Paucibacter sp. B2R-40]MCV2356272.1 peroxide stress protein YaaA [Paucibacter sp. B2R-40]